MFRQRTKKGSDMSRMDKKEKKQMEMEQQAREEALEEELEAELPVQEAQPQEAQPAAPTQEELDAVKAQAEEYLTLAQRVQADFDNFRRRNESVRADAYNEGIRSLAAVLLPVMDNLKGPWTRPRILPMRSFGKASGWCFASSAKCSRSRASPPSTGWARNSTPTWKMP